MLTAFPAGQDHSAALLASGAVGIVDEAVYADLLADAAAVLTVAAADAHLLACAWACDADVWSFDRDFAGTGWPSWSNANLLAALKPAA